MSDAFKSFKNHLLLLLLLHSFFPSSSSHHASSPAYVLDKFTAILRHSHQLMHRIETETVLHENDEKKINPNQRKKNHCAISKH